MNEHEARARMKASNMADIVIDDLKPFVAPVLGDINAFNLTAAACVFADMQSQHLANEGQLVPSITLMPCPEQLGHWHANFDVYLKCDLDDKDKKDVEPISVLVGSGPDILAALNDLSLKIAKEQREATSGLTEGDGGGLIALALLLSMMQSKRR